MGAGLSLFVGDLFVETFGVPEEFQVIEWKFLGILCHVFAENSDGVVAPLTSCFPMRTVPDTHQSILRRTKSWRLVARGPLPPGMRHPIMPATGGATATDVTGMADFRRGGE